MKNLLQFFALSILLNSPIYAQEIYKKAKIDLTNNNESELLKIGIDLHEGEYKEGLHFISDFSETELNKISQKGFGIEVIIENVSEYYKNRNKNTENNKRTTGASNSGCGFDAEVYQTPSNFTLGSMGGYYYYQEMLNELDAMAALYPNLITIKQEVAEGDTTFEGRPLWYVKISDNPNDDETEPEVLYTAVHHAREPMSMTQMIFYMWYMLENYDSNERVNALVNETELFFVPCINPDGYIYNETTDPFGGGMWRKNRFVFHPDTIGIDLNRNYGYNWGFDDFGSSADKLSNVYRGTEPFSEAETKMIRDFVESRNFLLTLNYHSFSNLLIFPWGYDYDIYTPDSAQYAKYGKLLTWYNIYKSGTGNQTVNYVTNGASDDWMYGEQTTKPKIFAFTPEVGNYDDGFWPQQSRIIDLCKENIFTNINTASMAGKFAVLNDIAPKLVNQSSYAPYRLEQFGMDTTGTFTVSIVGLQNIIDVGESKTYSNLFLMQELNDSISFTHSATTNGEIIEYVLQIDNGLYTLKDTVSRVFGNSNIAYQNNCSSILDFVSDIDWEVTTDYFVSPPSSITDSPFGNYFSENINYITTTTPIDLGNAIEASLTFYARWMLEARGDAVTIEASTDNFSGETIALCGNYTVNQSVLQGFDYPVYEGFQPNWIQEQISLNQFIGQGNLKLRFKFTSDFSVEYDGFYFDDLKVDYTTSQEVGIDETNKMFYLNANPNPAHNTVTVYYQAPAEKSLLVIKDASGRIVHNEKLTTKNGNANIDVSKLSAGLYFYQINFDGNLSEAKKLMLE
jgi:carboxypeptidase T